MERYLFLLLTLITLHSCDNTEPIQDKYNKLNAQHEQLLSEIETCRKENTEIKNTPERRLQTAQKYEVTKDTIAAEREYQELFTKFPKTDEGQLAKGFLDNLEKEREQKRIAEERKKQLGFKVLKESSVVEQGDVKLSFSNVKLSRNWNFDRYGDRYFYRGAERGHKYLTTVLSITSKVNSPKLPPIFVYKLEGDNLKYLATAQYEFFRWSDYGTYLGNNADYKNDFAHSQTIKFSPGVELTDMDTDTNPIFLMVKKSNCVSRKSDRFDNPPVSYNSMGCKYDRVLNVDQAEGNYFVVKIFNKKNI